MKLFKIILLFLCILEVLYCDDIGFEVIGSPTLTFADTQRVFLKYGVCDPTAVGLCSVPENECAKQNCFYQGEPSYNHPDYNPIAFKKNPYSGTFWLGTMSGIAPNDEFGTSIIPSLIFYRDKRFNGVGNNPTALRFQSIDFLPPSGYNIESCSGTGGIVFTCPMFGSFVLAVPDGPIDEDCTKVIYDFQERIIMDCVVDENTMSVWVFTGNPTFDDGDSFNVDPVNHPSTPSGFIYRIDLSDDVLDHEETTKGTLTSYNPFTQVQVSGDENGAKIEGWYPVSSAKDNVRGLIYVGGLDGIVVKIDPSTNTAVKVMDSIPGVHITKIVYHEATDSLILGTNIGIMIDVSAENFIMKNVFYLDGFPSVTGINVELYNDETILVLSSKDSDDVLKLWRANYVINPQTLIPELKVWDGLQSGFIVNQDNLGHSKAISSISSYYYDAVEGKVILIPLHTGELETVIEYSFIQIFKCNVLNCNDCEVRDPIYCTNCFQSKSIPTISCSSNVVIGEISGCNNPLLGSCPQALNAEPLFFPLGSSISTISIRGVNILPDHQAFQSNPIRAQCKFSTDTISPISRISKDVGRCTLPDISLDGADEKSFTVYIETTFPHTPWTDEVSFTVHDCSKQTCETCSSKLGCGWCRTQAKCTSLKQCGGNTDLWGSSCPSIGSVQPSSAPINVENFEIEITMNDFVYLEELNYKCVFKIGGVDKMTDAEYDTTSKSLLCYTPDVTGAEIGSTLSIGVEVEGTTEIYSISIPFEFYDCTQYTVCSLCVADSRSCEWCSDTNECKNYDELSDCSFDNADCSLITEAIPSSVYIDDIKDFDVKITGPFSGVFKCILKNEDHTIEIDAELVENSLKCKLGIVPSGSVFIGNYKLYIADDSGDQFSNEIAFIIYDCGATTCINCVGSSKSSCKWLIKDMMCVSKDSSTPGDSIDVEGNCPRISEITPSVFNSKRTTSIVMKGNFGNFGQLEDQSLFMCRFGTTMRRESFNFINSNTATCTSSSSMQPGEAPLAIYYGSKQYTNAIQVEAYSCELISTSKCLDFSCSLCALPTYHCANVCNPAHTIPTQPTITEVTPKAIDGDHSETLTIKGGPFILEGDNVYTCRFFSDENINYLSTFATRIDSSTLTCLSPNEIEEDYVNLEIGYSVDGKESSYLSTKLDVYRCNAGECESDEKCDESCVSAQPHCGWCYKTNKLSSRPACETGYWVKECPNFDGPKYLYSSTSGGEEIKITLNVLIGAIVNEYENMNARASPILCHFADLESDAIPTTSGGKTHISCISPSFESQTTMPFSLTWNGVILVEDTFEYANCNVNRTCTECPGGTSVCGTCFQLNQCGYPGACVNSNYNFSPICPSFLGLNPDSGSEDGGTEVIILGSPFYENMIDIEVYFGEELASNATYINETAISVLAPKNKVDSKGTEVRVYVNGNTYFTTTRSFTYTKEVSPVPIVLGVLFGLVLPISIAIAVLAFMKRKKLGIFKVYLKEPDYLEVIFGKHLKPLYKMPKDKYAELEEALMDEDPTLILAISAAVQPTDHDKLSRAFAELFYSHNRLKEYMIIFINDEVQRQLEENTVFRGNTIASKLFQLFAKIVATKFLWSKIARLMKELDSLGEERLKKEASRGLIDDEVELEQTDYLSNVQSKKKGGQSVFKVEMEVDPTRIIEDAIEEDAMDAQANAYQLILTCQKIWGTLVKSLMEIPDELREVFIVCKDSIKAKFNSDDAVYKTIGGFLFLRFICPAFTIPHSYGLLERPPNQISQRQFVLIGKVLQNLANMVMPGIKEPYMAQLDEFFRKNIPRMQEFYIEILKPNYNPEVSEKLARPVKPEDLPRTVVDNALSEIWGVIRGNKSIREYINETYKDDKKLRKRLNRTLDDLTATYDAPKLKKELKKLAP